MSAQKLIAEVQAIGGRFELSDDGFNVRAPHGSVTPTICEELRTHKPEIITLLKQTDAEVTVCHIAGLDCPHCRQPLQVFTHPLDEEVWIQCQTKPEIFKQLKH